MSASQLMSVYGFTVVGEVSTSDSKSDLGEITGRHLARISRAAVTAGGMFGRTIVNAAVRRGWEGRLDDRAAITLR